MELLRTASLLTATLTTGLLAGLLYAFACAVMPGLRRTDDRTFVAVLQRINVAIINPWFLLSFAGAPALTALATALHVGIGGAVLAWTAAALVLTVLTWIITMAVNVPLNNGIDAAGPPERTADVAAVRERFEARWVRWNIARTVTATAALGCLGWALVLHGAG